MTNKEKEYKQSKRSALDIYKFNQSVNHHRAVGNLFDEFRRTKVEARDRRRLFDFSYEVEAALKMESESRLDRPRHSRMNRRYGLT